MVKVGDIFTVCRWEVAGELRKEEGKDLAIIPLSDFPEGAPIHADGSAEFDVNKPLAYFGVKICTRSGAKFLEGLQRQYGAL